jgi:hypothetical protein
MKRTILFYGILMIISGVIALWFEILYFSKIPGWWYGSGIIIPFIVSGIGYIVSSQKVPSK